tara:strand:+ start:20611 stop:21012 length:402 start_codon:yes stop_codon:yes gene_type:complete
MTPYNKAKISQLIDSLPEDIIMECAKYICIPPVSLLKEIEHFGKINDSYLLIKKFKYNDMANIHYSLLGEWYNKYAISMINEKDGEHEGVCDLVMTYDKEEQNNIFMGFIKKLIFLIDPDVVNQKAKKIFNGE